MVVTVEFTRCVISTCILCIFIGKFSYEKEFSSVILLVVDKNPKVGLYYSVLSLGLDVSLRIKSNKEFLLHFQKVTE